MAISLSHFPILAVLVVAFASLAQAANVTFDWNITWVTANPDGLYDRPTIGINGQWPLPIMKVQINDTVIVNVDNQLGNQSTTLHFHGLYMYGTTEMDGPAMVSQCGIPAGSQFQYKFTVSSECRHASENPKLINRVGQPIWNVLVPLSRQGTVPGWTPRTSYH